MNGSTLSSANFASDLREQGVGDEMLAIADSGFSSAGKIDAYLGLRKNAKEVLLAGYSETSKVLNGMPPQKHIARAKALADRALDDDYKGVWTILMIAGVERLESLEDRASTYTKLDKYFRYLQRCSSESQALFIAVDLAKTKSAETKQEWRQSNSLRAKLGRKIKGWWAKNFQKPNLAEASKADIDIAS